MANATNIQLNLKAIGDFSDVTGDISQVQKMLQQLKLPANLTQNFDGIFTDLTRETKKYQSLLDSGFKKKSDVTGLESSGQRINKLLQKLKQEMGKIDPSMLEKSFQVDPTALDALNQKMKDLQGQLTKSLGTEQFASLKKQADAAALSMSKISKTKFTSNFTEAYSKGDIQGAAEALKQLEANHKQFNQATEEGRQKEQEFQNALNGMKTALEALKGNTEIQDLRTQIANLDTQIDQLDADELQRFIQTFQQGKTDVNNMTQGVQQFTQQTQQAAQAQNSFSSQVDQLKTQVTYFFGLTNAVYILRNALTQAFNTVKELDAVMTETAVVTDFTVGDMWEKLPEYTENASALGASVKDLYSATTLYYQQGLKTDAAMGVGIETMKMARIANMDAAEATQAMTAALRGFGMAVNETNALRVNDVYSELAAITASDTEQIATAMSKTASIAASANMEFETTAALLAQIIETTQEAPETAGTALKTIIARFSEVKELRDSGKSRGEDEEGEVIDVNKIDKALKSVGISMDAFFAGQEGLDDVLTRLAEKWGTLDFETQRYIATMAAGSRQQSRFIAMMSDYGRTTELVGAANSSAGASQEQFNKTLESLDSKLARLSNAWNEFVMGIADSSLIKAGIDALIGLLEAINNITDGLPGIGKGIANLLVVFGALRIGGKIFNALFTSISSQFAIGGKKAGISFRKALSKEFSGVKALFSKKAWTIPPINTKTQVAAINNLDAARKRVLVTQKLQETSTKKLSASQVGQTAIAKQAAAAERHYATTLTETSAALGLNSAQQAVFTSLLGAGIATDVAAMAAKNGLTTAMYNEMAAQAVLTTSNAAEAKAKLETMIATYNSIAAKEAEQAADGFSITQKIALWAAILFGNKAKKAEALAHLQAAAAKGVETGATWALAVAEWAACVPAGVILLIIIAIIAAVALLVIGIIALIKAIKNNTPEAKMKKLREEAEAAAEAADEAKQAFEDFLDTRKEYEEMIAAMEELTYGTSQWKESLVEANEQVLELIRKYPSLAGYMALGENGQLTIAQEGWDMVENQLSSQAKTSAIIAQIKQDNLNFGNLDLFAQQTKKNTTISAGGETSSYATTSSFGNSGSAVALQEEIERLKQQGKAQPIGTSTTDKTGYSYTTSSNSLGYSEVSTYTSSKGANDDGTYNVYSDEFKALAAKYGMTAQDLYDNLDRINNFAGQHAQVMQQIILSASDSELQASKYFAGITEGLSETLDLQKIRDTKTAEWKDGGDYWSNGKDTSSDALKKKIEDYNLKNGTSIAVTGDEKQDMAAYYQELTGEEYDLEAAGKGADDELAKKIADAEAAQQISGYTSELFKASKEYEQIGNVFKNNLDMSANLEELEALAKTAGLSAEALEALKHQYEDIQQQRADIDLRMAEILGQEYTAGFSVDFAGSYKSAQDFLNTFDQLAMSAGAGAAALYADLISDVGAEGAPAMIKQFSEVDWSSSIEGAAALKDMLLNGSEAATEFAIKMYAINPALYSVGSQVNELYDIIGEDTIKDLGKDGKITASEIMELAKSCDEINTVMDTTGISAGTLASYYEMLEDGTLDMVSATGDFIKVLEKLNAAQNTIQNSFAFIDNFEVERSQTEIGQSFQDMQTSMRELYDKGAYSDAQLVDYVKTFIGEENWGDLIREKGGDMKAAMDEVMKTLPENGENMYQSWKAFAQTDNSGMASLDANGGIQFDMTQFTNIDELKQQIMSSLNVSEVMAEAMIADAQTFSSDFSQGLQALSIEDALTEWISSAVEVNGKKIISEKELQAFAKQAGLDPEELKKALEKEDLGVEINVVPYLNDDGTLSDTLRQQMLDNIKSMGVFDLDQAYQMLLEVGLDDEAAKAELNNMATSLVGMPVSANGEQLGKIGENLDIVTETGAKNGTVNGVVQGMQDPATAAAQELNSLEQGKMMAKAVSSGVLTASGAALAGIAGSIDSMINGLVDIAAKVGITIPKSNLAGKVTNTTNALITSANSSIDAQYDGDIAAVNAELAAAVAKAEEDAKKAREAAQKAMDDIDINIDTSTSAYTETVQQTKPESKGGGSKKWENSYDKQYNLIRQINEAIREREKLERRYEKLMESRKASAKEVMQISLRELATLQQELSLQKQMQSNRISQLATYQAQNQDMAKYGKVVEDEFGNLTVRIDWDAINAVTDSDKGEKIEKYIGNLEEWISSIEEAEDAIYDIEDAVDEIRSRGEDNYFDLESKIVEALENSMQQEIDKLDELNSTIEETNSNLIDAMQSALDKERQLRENEETEKDLSDKQRKLAYLQQDTSGANALEIQQLQKELDEATQDYTDTLIDQKITELQEQNDKAAEQRAQQIEIMQSQLDHFKESGEIWDKVYELMDSGLDETNGLVRGSELESILQSSDNFSGLSNLSKMKWLDELNAQIADALSYLKIGRQLEGLEMEGEEISFTNADGQVKKGKVDSNGNITTSDGEIYTDVYQGADGNFYTTESQAAAKKRYDDAQKPKEEPKKEEEKVEEPKTTNPYGKPSEYSKTVSYGMTGDKVKRVQHALNEMGYRTGKIDGIFGNNTKNAVMEFQRDAKTYGWNPDIGKPDGVVGPRTRKAFAFKKYVTGGLADFTGPAWLDGTKSKPEYVLNSDQTKAFFQLVDVLSSLQSGGSKATEKTGDNTYDIDINVESIGSDYDVEQLANTVKRLINEDARYRNNNAINLMR